MEKFLYVRFFGSQNGFPDKKMAIKKALQNRNWALKITYQIWIQPSNILSGQESGHHMFFPDIIFLTG